MGPQRLGMNPKSECGFLPFSCGKLSKHNLYFQFNAPFEILISSKVKSEWHVLNFPSGPLPGPTAGAGGG